MITQGRLLFVVIFILVFAMGMVWSYRKEKKLNDVHFKRTYQILLGLVLFLIIQFLIVKMRKFL